MNVYIRQFAIELRRNGPWFAFKKVLGFLYLRVPRAAGEVRSGDA